MGKQQTGATIRLLMICCAVLFLTSYTSNESWAAEKKFPNRVINVVVAYAPGSTDVYTRPYLEKMAEYLGQPMSFVYKPGAAGTVGSSYAAKAKPDGYTLMAANQGPVLLGPVTKEDVDYTYDSFIPVCQLVSVPMFLAVRPESPLKTLDDIIAAAKKSPGKLTFSTSGVFSTPHLGMEIFQKAAGIKLTHVPTAGSAPAVTALLGDHVAMTASGIGPLKPHADAGTLRLIALMEEKRLKTYPNIPTFLELGYRVVFPNWYGLLAPKGTPKEIIDTIFEAAKKANDLNRDSIEKQCKQLGIEVSFLNTDEFDKSNREQLKTIISIFKDIRGK
jgi:tripartite-type tricarboxylate transporter receptor subunit TctC